MFHIFYIILISAVIFVSPAYGGSTRFKDEGVVQGYAWDVDCVGAGIICSWFESKATISVSGIPGTSSLSDLADTGDTSAISGYVLIADGTDFISRQISGDITLGATGIMTIGDDKIGTAKLNDGGDTPVAGECVQVAVGATTFEYGACGGSLSMSDLTDTGDTTATSKNILIADGTNWVSQTISGDITIGSTGIATVKDFTLTDNGDANSNKIINLTDPTLDQDAATKIYVDASTAAFNIDFFYNNTASDVGGIYFDMTSAALGGGESLLGAALSASTNDQAIANFLTDDTGGLGILDISAGTFEIHFHAEKTAGSSTVNIYAEVYKRTSGGAETLIVTSGTSGVVTSKSEFSLFAHAASDTNLLATDRIVIKFLANLGSGSGATVALYQEGTTVSRLVFPTTSEILNQIFVRQDGTTPLLANWDAGSFKITAETLESDVSTGTPPLVVASTTEVANLRSALATALAANPTDCDPNEFANTIAASGNLGCVQPALSDLSDIGTSTATSKNILIADGTNFNSQTVSGDITIGTTGIITIQPNVIDGTNIAIGSDAIGDIMYYDGTDWAILAAGTSGKVLNANGTAAPTWETSTSGASSLTGLSDVDITTLTSGRMLVADGTNFNSVQISGDITINSNGVTTVSKDVTVVMHLLDSTEDATIDNTIGGVFFTVPESITGWNLLDAQASVHTAGIDATLTLQVYNKTDSVNMLSTAIEIDTTETDSSTAAAPSVVDTGNDDVVTGDQIVINASTIHTGTASKGQNVRLTFGKP